MLGIVICTHNRPEYLKECLDSLRRAEIPEEVYILIVDDNSDRETVNLLAQTNYRVLYRRDPMTGVATSLLIGLDKLFERCDLVMNLDSDAVVRNDFIEKITSLKDKFPESIVTGFNTNTKNKDGSQRHKVISSHTGYNLKPSVGGINMCFSKKQYLKYVRPALLSCRIKGNWDNQACINAYKDGHPVAVVEPSVIQHIGVKSSLGHELPDTADDFKLLSLPNVTLINTACVNFESMIKAANACEKDIEFGSVKILTHLRSTDKRVVRIPQITTIEKYSKFLFKELHKYVDTDFALTFHPDGYVVNAKAWRKEWLKYDYIGAPWEWYQDEYKVGNGGFALRSKKLLKATSELTLINDHLIKNLAEDHNLSRIWRPKLEKKYGIKFAPVEEARKFSIEAWNAPSNKYNGQFGFHSTHVDFTGADIPFIPYKYPNHKRIINYP